MTKQSDKKKSKPYSSKAVFAAFTAGGTLIWIIWNESFSVANLVVGTLLSALCLAVSNRFLLRARYQDMFRIHPLLLLRYIGVLIPAIFQSGIHAIYVTITGRIQVQVIDLPTRIDNPFHGALVANAITLTPGTVTVDYSNNRFKVIWIECPTTDPEAAAELIKGRFERVFVPDEQEKETL